MVHNSARCLWPSASVCVFHSQSCALRSRTVGRPEARKKNVLQYYVVLPYRYVCLCGAVRTNVLQHSDQSLSTRGNAVSKSMGNPNIRSRMARENGMHSHSRQAVHVHMYMLYLYMYMLYEERRVGMSAWTFG